MKRTADHDSIAHLLALFAAIDGAAVRLRAISNVEPLEYAKAAMQELGNIVKAKDAYDMAVQIDAAAIAGGVPIQEPLPVLNHTRDEAMKS